MAASGECTKSGGKRKGILHLALAVTLDDDNIDFGRADLIFEGVDHSQISYEVRVFLNNKRVDHTTEREVERGYAGRFIVFGHGGCMGGRGHCDPDYRQTSPFDHRPPHPLLPQTKIVHAAGALMHLYEAGKPLKSVTMVPVLLAPNRKDRTLADGVFRFETVRLKLYPNTVSVMNIVPV